MALQMRNGNIQRLLSTGPMEGKFLTDLERYEIPVFSLRKHRGVFDALSDRQLYELLRALTKKGWLLRVERGTYVVVPRAARRGWREHPFVIAAAITSEPYYISFWSALSFHNLTEQMPLDVAVVTEHAKRPVAFQGRCYRFIGRPVNSFFGIEHYKIVALNGAAHVNVSIADPEKTVLDALANEGLSGGMLEVIAAIRRGLDNGVLSPDRLATYALHYSNKAIIGRLGYILSHTGVDGDAINKLRVAVRRNGYPPYLAREIVHAEAYHDDTWNIMINLPLGIFETDE